VEIDEIIPEELPPNDDLDLQVLWLKVLEEKGPSLTPEDLADAWLEGCWYPFNEYGNFRRNYRVGIRPPYTGMFDNELFESGMGCPIRSEIWGYVFPGAADLAARYAWKDGVLDHTDESVCAEQMFAAMAADAFFCNDLRRLSDMHMHRLKPGLTVRKLVESAFRSYDEGLTLREAHERLVYLHGHPEPCDARLNVAFTFLAMLYGDNDLEKTILYALQCGYDTDCTLATAGAFIGQFLGASKIPQKLRDIIGDELVMGIEYNRPEMTLSALARDTATVGLRLAKTLGTGVVFGEAPGVDPYPAGLSSEPLRLRVDYATIPAAAPGETVPIKLTLVGAAQRGLTGDAELVVDVPEGWDVLPRRAVLRLLPGVEPSATLAFHAREDAAEWKQAQHFRVKVVQGQDVLCEETFGVSGAMLWRCLGVYLDPAKPDDPEGEITKEQILSPRGKFGRRYYVALDRRYIDESAPDVTALYEKCTRVLGRPAVVSCHTSNIRLDQITGIDGEYCAYLAGEIVCPDEREAQFWLGRNDGCVIWLNGTEVFRSDTMQKWAPATERFTVQLSPGRNQVILKLLRRCDVLKFTFGVRQEKPTDDFPRRNDWCTDLAWVNPLAV
jgi:ADP-ribosylglycohydrolase